jgi:uncharacterized coiled-coil protein SlyX
MLTQDAIYEVAKAIVKVAEEMNKLTQEVIKLNERLEDATTSNRSRRRES